MRRHTGHIISILCVILFLVSQCFGAEVKFSPELYQQLSQSRNAVPRITIPDYTKIVLENGLTVYLAEAHDLPIITIEGRSEWGRSLENAGIAGISDCMAEMMNEQSRRFKDQEMAKYKEKYALGFNVSAADDCFGFHGNALITEQERLLSLAAEVLQRPKFDGPSLQRKKAGWQRNLEQSKTDEDCLLNQYFYRNIMKGHSYAYSNDFELGLKALNNITPATLGDYYQRTFMPNHTILFVYGNFKIARMSAAIKRYFGRWHKNDLDVKLSKIAENTDTFGKIILVDKPDATHAKIKMGYSFFDQLFFEDKLQDKAALNIANQIFGGGDFESLLMNEIRVNRGYAYDISSEISYLPLGGAFTIDTSVKPDKAWETVETVKKIMMDLKLGKQKIHKADVFKEINRFNALLPESYRDRDMLIWDTVINIEIKKRNKSYLNQFIQLYNNVTADKAEQAFSKYFYPEKLFTVIVGKKEAIMPQFEAAGIKVEVVDVQ